MIEIFLTKVVFVFMIVFTFVAFMFIRDINLLIIDDLRRRPNLRWYQYIADSSTLDLILYITFCLPGLLIGDLGKEQKLNIE